MLFEDFLGLTKFKVINPPSIEPPIKLVPIMKLIGSGIVSSFKKFTLDLFALFWIPISNKKKKVKFKALLNKIFFNLKTFSEFFLLILKQIINQIFL